MTLYAELTAARQHSAGRFLGSLSLAPRNYGIISACTFARNDGDSTGATESSSRNAGGCVEVIEHFFTAPGRLQRRPLPPLTWSPHPRVRGWASLWRKKELCHCTALPTPVQGWVASAYILSCAPPACHGGEGHEVARGDCQRHAACGS